MEAVVKRNTVFNPIQQHLLMMFSHMNSEEQLKELKKALADFYFDQVEREWPNLKRKDFGARKSAKR